MRLPDVPVDDARPTVLCIIGKGRSGSTLLDMILGQLDGVFSTGELGRLWEWGLTHGYRCGCGEPVDACPTWRPIVERAFEGDPEREARRVIAWQEHVLRWPRVPRLLLQRPGRLDGWPELEAYASHLSDVYRSIAERTGARVIVDSTKWPASPTPLGLVPGVDARIVQLVRDPRAVAFSWRRRKRWSDRPGEREMPRYGVLFSMASWWARNLTAETVRGRHPRDHSTTVRYEDLVRQPRDTIRMIAELVGAGDAELPFVDERTALLEPTHTVGGNPARLNNGRIELHVDDQWIDDQPTLDRVTGTLLGIPLLGRYGYRIRPSRADDVDPVDRVTAA